MTIFFPDNEFVVLHRAKGHLYIFVQAFYEGSHSKGRRLNLILDTGAYVTVLSRRTAIRCGYDKLPLKEVTINGFGGNGEPADAVRIPGLKILNKLVTDVPVLIPHRKDLTQEVLGLNVLEYFNYYVDTENSRLYLKLNPNPQSYDPIIACGQIFTLASDGIDKPKINKNGIDSQQS